MTNISWRKATEADREFFRRVHHGSYRQVIEAIFGWDEALQDRLANNDFDTRNIHIIYKGGDRCGVLGWMETADSIEIGPLYLTDDYQGSGIGTWIARDFISRYRGKNLILKTLKSNERAKALYERLGFIVTEANDKYWHMQYAG
ncbi:MAG: GNAT family N-acetyltransferase [Bacteroidetes bacterium]|nr:GNAT family N-acetyltransferase [Bacteroidota bacterium]